MSRIKRILVPTDFSAASDIAFDYAIDLAARLRSAIHLLHVIDDTSLATAYPAGLVELPGLRVQLTAETTRRLKDMAAKCATEGVSATIEVSVGRPARLIAQKAGSRGADLIVMGTHGRSGFAHLILGSVAERIVRTAPCAVLTVRETSRAAAGLRRKRSRVVKRRRGRRAAA